MREPRAPVAGPAEMVGAVHAAPAGCRFECAHDVAVVEEEPLVGIVPLERLLAADSDLRISDVMNAEPPVVEAGADQRRPPRRRSARAQGSVIEARPGCCCSDREQAGSCCDAMPDGKP